MKNNQSKKYLYAVVLLVFIMTTTFTFGQPSPPPPPAPTPGVPFGAIEILLAGLVGYGAKKYYDKEKS